MPILQNTKFGWIVSGSILSHMIVNRMTNRQVSNNHAYLITQRASVDDIL